VVEAVRAEAAATPAAITLALATVVFVVVLGLNGGFGATVWYPAGLILTALALVTALSVRAGGVPRAVVVAAVALVAYAAWSYASVSWADQTGDALDGANRTALFSIVFALFATWRVRASGAALVLGMFGLGVALVGLWELLAAAGATDPSAWFVKGRFAEPVGYQNANVALWAMAFWPCATLAARREVAPPLRALLAAAAVLLAGLALLGESRGWAFAMPITAVVYLAVVPQRVRAALVLLVIVVATVPAVGPVLDVYDAAHSEAGYGDSVAAAARALLLCSGLAALAVGVVAVLDRRARPSRMQVRRVGAGLLAAAAVAALAGGAVLTERHGSPFDAVADAWDDFKTEPQPEEGGGSRFGVSLGSNRYDFWRVAWGNFAGAPLAGVGADNFQQDYLREGRSTEQPRYPHSVELRTLSQTGILGALMLVVALAAAALAALAAIRERTGIGAAVAAGCLTTFAYWLAHGSVDWFWEFAGLGGVAFALLGLAAGMRPRQLERPRLRPGRGRRVALAAAAAATCFVAIAFGAPWLSARGVDRAAAEWRADSDLALDRLEVSASLNPLSARPYLFAGTIAQRAGRPRVARGYYVDALGRDPRDAYAHLQVGLLDAAAGRRRSALEFLARAAELNPRDPVTSETLDAVRRGERVSLESVNERYVERTEGLSR
jgi:O-antigen ligase